jgi:hypothetical protein
MHKECFPDQGWQVVAKLKRIIDKYEAVLAGGTALALQTGHRLSHDLDFFTEKKFTPDALISMLKKAGLSYRVVAEGEGSLVAEVEGKKVSFFSYDYRFLEKPVTYEGLPLAGLLDIADMKVIAISQRGTKRDFVDLYVILQLMPFHKIADHMVKRFGRQRISPVHIGKSLAYFSDADSDPEPSYIKGRTIKWETIKKFFKTHVKQFVLDLDAAVKEE